MEQNLKHTVSLLARTPHALNPLLYDLPEAWTNRNEGENTWSVFDVVGHLAHVERTDWLPRVRMVLQSGEAQALVGPSRSHIYNQRSRRDVLKPAINFSDSVVEGHYIFIPFDSKLSMKNSFITSAYIHDSAQSPVSVANSVIG